MNETLITILEIPLVWRVAIVALILWGIYALLAGGLFKIAMLLLVLINEIWLLTYKLFNTFVHMLHSRFGKVFAAIDQAVTDFFGGIYSFIEKIKVMFENVISSKAFFRGTAFIILAVLTVWIVLPIWLDIEQNSNLLTVPHHKYIEIERAILDMIFSVNVY